MASLRSVDDFQLRIGSVIEVLYHVDGQGYQWWPAHVIQLHASVKDTASLSIQVKYTAMYGFRSSTQVLHVLTCDKVHDKDGTEYPWRRAEEEQVSAECETDSKDASYLPDENVKKRKVIECSTKEESTKNHVKYEGHSGYTRMQRELDALKLRVQELENREIPLPSHAQTSGVLSYLGNRLSVLLERFPSLPVKHQHSRVVFQYFSQNFLRKSADCSLSEMDVIVERVCAKAGDNAVCFPSQEQSLRYVPQDITIEFNDFRHFLNVFGSPSLEEVDEVVWKWKSEKTSTSTFGIRMIGSSVHNDSKEDLPSLLLPACSLQCTGDMDIFVRSNTSWNTVEGIFDFPLEKKSLSSAQLKDYMQKMQLKDADMSNMIHSSKFKLKWTPESPVQQKRILMDDINRVGVLGALTAIIPYVLIRGSANCEEVIKLLHCK